MKHRDFGRLDGPVVLFGGVYSNLQAMEAFVKVVDGRDAVCTGDIVAYCANPVETSQFFLDMGWAGIAGNCERRLLEGASDCGCGFEDGSACDILSAGWWPYLLQEMDPRLVQRLNEMPDIGSLVHRGKRFAVIHGGASATNRFLWPSSPKQDFLYEIAVIERTIGPIDGVIAGHSGLAFHRRIERWQWINAGAIGLPPHDGRSETRFAVLEDGEVVINRLFYDHETAIERMREAGLTQGYHNALASGIWPSEDVLPIELRR